MDKLKRFSDSVVARKIEAWQGFIAVGLTAREHVLNVIDTWLSVGLLDARQHARIMRNLP